MAGRSTSLLSTESTRSRKGTEVTASRYPPSASMAYRGAKAPHRVNKGAIGSLRVRIAKRLKSFRSLSVCLVVCIALVAVASTFTLFLANQQVTITQTGELGQMTILGTRVDTLFRGLRGRTCPRKIANETLQWPSNGSSLAPPGRDSASRKMILVFDFWERMVNIQSALRRLVHLGVDGGFTVVEPFVYESKVSPHYAFPEHFQARGMTPQPASLYFQTDELYATKSFVSHAKFRDRTQIGYFPSEEARQPNSGATPDSLIQALVFFDWSKRVPKNNCAFDWCDWKLRSYPWTRFGFQLAPHVHVQRALCISSLATMEPTTFTASMFQELFAFVAEGTRKLPMKCPECVTLAFTNYRKHAFTGFISHTGRMPFKEYQPPLNIGAEPQRLARQVREDIMYDRPYVALQIRTGKAYVLWQIYESRLRSQSIGYTRNAAFLSWLKSCTKRLVYKAQRVGRQLGPGTMFYIASDMYNEGWKGGETCPRSVCYALEEAKRALRRELGVVRFIPDEFDIRQDKMGISGLADAALCLQADRFVYALPSNFGGWVKTQREVANRGSNTTVQVDCMDPRFDVS